MAKHQLTIVSEGFPSELILQMVQYLPFKDGRTIAALRHAHPRIKALLDAYECSITKSFVKNELRHAPTDFSYSKEDFRYEWLAECAKNYNVVDDVMGALICDQNCFAVERNNMALVNTGLLLMYKLLSHKTHATKLTFIKSLRRDPLIAMYLALHHATLAARYHGSGWMHQRTYGRFLDGDQLSLRNELEFCFAEGMLTVGPKFISDMLLNHASSDAETTLLNLYHDYGVHDWEWPSEDATGEFEPPRTQGPRREPGSMGRSLFTTLLERMADVMDCLLEEVRMNVERDTERVDHPLAYLNLEGKARLLQGFDLEG
ncbi:hypothetical protein P153DRAFT_421635 [Dothidotthia symphoricarpi CBS 119687]|uniref:F-box domain-containing protein n=1 Tax=Dothidotthia symphoricarpi CBS 119687 TaxID=1392245 RepID=A0A6A6AIK7_9PLEO|nr:uncharacterized protein P153DRAFT_421635 [Dothidotthia symphoricarpi CBS 119687]KAF2131640.1 hypothetical protein P153DRAFT_421635 [Dothidotthia symphoricarpi CBS 119687]